MVSRTKESIPPNVDDYHFEVLLSKLPIDLCVISRPAQERTALDMVANYQAVHYSSVLATLTSLAVNYLGAILVPGPMSGGGWRVPSLLGR